MVLMLLVEALEGTPQLVAQVLTKYTIDAGMELTILVCCFLFLYKLLGFCGGHTIMTQDVLM